MKTTFRDILMMSLTIICVALAMYASVEIIGRAPAPAWVKIIVGFIFLIAMAFVTCIALSFIDINIFDRVEKFFAKNFAKRPRG